jgi:hypothetical protein
LLFFEEFRISEVIKQQKRILVKHYHAVVGFEEFLHPISSRRMGRTAGHASGIRQRPQIGRPIHKVFQRPHRMAFEFLYADSCGQGRIKVFAGPGQLAFWGPLDKHKSKK